MEQEIQEAMDKAI